MKKRISLDRHRDAIARSSTGLREVFGTGSSLPGTCRHFVTNHTGEGGRASSRWKARAAARRDSLARRRSLDKERSAPRNAIVYEQCSTIYSRASHIRTGKDKHGAKRVQRSDNDLEKCCSVGKEERRGRTGTGVNTRNVRRLNALNRPG